MADEGNKSDEVELSKEEARELIKAIEDVEREEAGKQSCDRQTEAPKQKRA